MKKVIIFLIMVNLILGGIVYASDARDERDKIEDRCAGIWYYNNSMADTCYINQVRFMNNSVRVLEYYYDRELTKTEEIKFKITLQCFDRWYDQSYDTYNFFMVNGCIQNQLKSVN